MRIAIVGAGAIGSLLGGFITKTGYDTVLIDNHLERCTLINEKGLFIDGVSGEHLIQVKSTVDSKSVGEVDFVFMCVKAYDTKQAMTQHKYLVGEKTTVTTMQNGLGNFEEIADVIGQEKVVAGTTSSGGYFLRPGHLRHAGNGAAHIGELSGEITKRITTIEKILNDAGFNATIAPNIEQPIWTKLIINVGINALTALLRVNNGYTSSLKAARAVQVDAVAEALAVAKAAGVKIDYDKVADQVVAVARATEQNISSMLNDVIRTKRTEIDFINGAVCKIGEKFGVDTPVNRTLTHLIKATEQAYALAVT